MIFLSSLDLTIPLKNPVIIFSLVLFIILFAPILFSRIKVPHIIGLILAGVMVGPYGLNLLRRDSSIVLFGTVGLLYIMFLAGLEIDLAEFRKNRKKIIFFGLTTFVLPLTFGSLASYYILGFDYLSSLLLASMFSTHTLVAYPIASRYGVTKNRAVSMTVGGTMITDILALLILAAIAGTTRGEVSSAFWIQLGVSSIVFVGVIFFVFPIIIQWFFKTYEDSISQYIFVLAMVFLASFLAELAGVEPIIGAFFSGLVLNRFVPHSSPLMNRIDFVGNAIFIPFFLISVGMLVDVTVLVKGFGALKVAAVIIFTAIVTKYIAAWITQKTFKLSKDEGKMIFGLSTSHAAATLAIILVGYNIIIGETASGEPIRLLNEDVLNGTILLILVSCAVSSFVVEKASQNLALNEEEQNVETLSGEKILISLADLTNVQEMLDLALMLKPKKSNIPIFALHVTDEKSVKENASALSKKIMDKAVIHAAATENIIIPLTRYDVNVGNGIIYTIKEHNITDIVIGVHHKKTNSFLGPKGERVLKRVSDTIYFYKAAQPINTIKRMVVVIPPHAELEPGFLHWYTKLETLAKEAGMDMVFYGGKETLEEIKNLIAKGGNLIKGVFNVFFDWEDFLILTRDLKMDDLFIVVSSRKDQPSYNEHLDKISYYLTKYFENTSFMVLYPKQMDYSLNMGDIQQVDPKLVDTISEKISVLGKRIFKDPK